MDYTPQHLNLKEEDAAEIKRALLHDKNEYHGIPLEMIYRGMINAKDTSIPTVAREKIEAWRDNRFFIIKPPNCTTQLLYTTTSTQILTWSNVDDEEERESDYDRTKVLVVVVPDMAKVRVTNLAEVTEMGAHFSSF